MAGPVRISILTDTRDATRGFAKVSASAKNMGVTIGSVGSSIKGAFLAGGALLAASGITEGFKKVVDAGADLQAAMGTNKQIFKESAAGLIAWSKDSATALGVSQAEALNATKTFGAFFTGIGMGTKQAASMSEQWSVMAANMAAFADLPTADALDSIQAALRGEMDPLQKYVPTVNAAAVAQKAMELTGKKSSKALTMQDKALALNAMLNESVANKAGKAERAQGGYGVQMEKLKAQLTDAAAAVGSALLPKLTALAKWINDKVIPAVKEFWATHGPALKEIASKVGDALGSVASKAAPIIGFLSKFNVGIVGLITNADKIAPALAGIGKSDVGKSLGDSFGRLGGTLKGIATSPEMTSIFDKFKTGFESLKTPVMKFVNTVKPIIGQVAKFMADKWEQYAPTIKATLSDVGAVVGQIFEGIKLVVERVTAAIGFIWANFGGKILGVIGGAFGAVVAVFRGAFQIIKGIFDVILGVLTGDWSRAWDGVKGVIRGVVTIVKGAVNAMRSVIALAMSVISKGLGAAWNWIKGVTSSVWSGIKGFFVGIWNGIVSFLTGIVGKVKAAISNAWNTAKSTTTTMWGRIKQAVSDGVTGAVNFVKELPGKIKAVFVGAGSWLYDSGKALIQGLIDGIGALADKAAQTAKDVWNSVTSKFTGGGGGKKASGGTAQALGTALAVGMAKAKRPLTKAGQSLYNFLQSGLIQGMTGGSGKLASTVKSLTSKIQSAFPTKYKIVKRKGKKDQKVAISNPVQKRMLATLDTANRSLKGYAKRWDTTVRGIATKTADLNNLRSARADMLANVADTIKQSFQLVDQAAQVGDTSIRKILLRSGEAVAQARTFADQLTALRAKSLSPAVLQELAAAGPEAGAATARSLMAATDQQISELNANYKMIADSGVKAGNAVAGSFYDPLITSSANALKQLTADRVSIEAQMTRLAMNLQSTVSKAVVKYAVIKPKSTGKAPTKSKKPASKPRQASVSAVPAGAGVQPIYMTVNTGAVVDKRGLVDTISSAINEVAAAMGRPVKLAVEVG